MKCFPVTTQTQSRSFQTITATVSFNSFPFKARFVGKEPVPVFLHPTTKKGQKGSIQTEVSQTSTRSWALLLACPTFSAVVLVLQNGMRLTSPWLACCCMRQCWPTPSLLIPCRNYSMLRTAPASLHFIKIRKVLKSKGQTEHY